MVLKKSFPFLEILYFFVIVWKFFNGIITIWKMIDSQPHQLVFDVSDYGRMSVRVFNQCQVNGVEPSVSVILSNPPGTVQISLVIFLSYFAFRPFQQ